MTGSVLLVLLVELTRPLPWAASLLMVAVGSTIGACALRGRQVVAVKASAWPTTFLIAPR